MMSVFTQLQKLSQTGDIDTYILHFDWLQSLLPKEYISDTVLARIFMKGLNPTTCKELRLLQTTKLLTLLRHINPDH